MSFVKAFFFLDASLLYNFLANNNGDLELPLMNSALKLNTGWVTIQLLV